ncbi:adaptor protein MecA [Peptococcus simiae]|uniref:Adaptor protein MecA n=1 Tax=Peptococcus simiae TaxID=1643805 RepID=A0ABW9GYA4_9FIRM
MKFKRLSDDKLQIIITQDDLNLHALKKWELAPYNPQAQELFQEILEKANRDCGFEVHRDSQLMVEAYPISSESMIMTITKVSEGRLPFDFDQASESSDDALKENLAQYMDAIEDDLVTIYEFDSLEYVIETAHALDGFYQAESQVYKGRDGQYYLLFGDMGALDGRVLGHLLEYGNRTRYSRAYLSEHAHLIIADKAIEKLASV